MGIDTIEGNPSLVPGLSIIHSNHLEDLRQVAVEWIRKHPLNPLENEIFIVQSNGMAQWLKLALAENDGCGISAVLDFQLPSRFLWNAYRAILGTDEVPRESPFDKTRLTWRLMRLLPSLLKDGCFSLLNNYLADDWSLLKRYQLACRLADLYDQYQVYRADWLEDWSQNQDCLRSLYEEPLGLPQEQKWQPELWRRIRMDVPEHERGTSRSSLHQRFLQSIAASTRRPSGLPRRIIVFGICSMPKQALEAIHALSDHSQTLLFVHNPCRHYWADIVEDRDLMRTEQIRKQRKSQLSDAADLHQLHQQVHPLLAAWGKQGRDYIRLLSNYDRPDDYRSRFAEIDLFRDVVITGTAPPASLLHQVQQTILDMQPLPAGQAERCCVAPGDTSISFQQAHSRQREMEILHDQLLSCFEISPDLMPRDIIIMAPDIDGYAPHIEAVFGNFQVHDRRFIPFAIADKPEHAGIPMLMALDKLLHLPDLRMTVSDIIGLLEVPAFQGRFGLTEMDISKLHHWIDGSGIRWGFNAVHRREFNLPADIESNTWQFGLNRMLLGYAVGTGDSWEEIEPYDEIGGLDASLVGHLAAILEKLEKHWRILRQPAVPDIWHQRILNLMTDCFLADNSRDMLTRRRAEEVLEKWRDACMDAGLTEPLPLEVVREAFLSAMNESGVSQRFLAGTLNFCTLMPMRAIPFKVVCLIGVNDGEYPRSHPPLDFDLMAGCYRPGDRSRREDDRYLFLEALLSAREKFYISYLGRNVRDNSVRMPSVLVGQLRDYLAAGWRVDGSDRDLLDHLTCQHPLQPFSRAYFNADQSEKLFTYAREWREVLDNFRSSSDTETSDPALPLHIPQHVYRLNFQLLIRFLKNPVQYFCNQRLNVYFDSIDTADNDMEPFILDRLSDHRLGAELMSAGLAAGSSETGSRILSQQAVFQAVCRAAERLRQTGELPLNGFGELTAEYLKRSVLGILENHDKLCRKWPIPADAEEISLNIRSVDPAGGEGMPEADSSICLFDSLLEDFLDKLRKPQPLIFEAGLYARWEFTYGNMLVRKNRRTGDMSLPDSKNLNKLTGLWVKHLAGCAQGMKLTSFLASPDCTVRLQPITREAAESRLTEIVSYLWMGMCRPLPVTAISALAFLTVLSSDNSTDSIEVKQQKAAAAARMAYQGNDYKKGEVDYCRYLQRFFPDFDRLWEADNHQFHKLAETLYAPLIQSVYQSAAKE